MTNLILILSKFKGIKDSDKQKYYIFHFRGFYKGEKINAIKTKMQLETYYKADENYLIWAKGISIQSGILEVEVIKSKKIT